MNRLIIIGASGHGKVVADIALLNGYRDIVFLDDIKTGKCAGLPIIGKCNEAPEGDVFVAIGDEAIRKYWMDYYKDRKLPILSHPNATISKRATIGKGSVIMAGAVINPDSIIGNGCIINTCSSIDHECHLNDYVHVAVGAHLCGDICIGEGTWIGAGATIVNNINICSNCIIGAGAVVIKDITEAGTYVGIPVKKVK